jgi:hypothetical protein
MVEAKDMLSRPAIFYDQTFFLSDSKYISIGIADDFSVAALLVNVHTKKFILFSTSEFENLLWNLSLFLAKIDLDEKHKVCISQHKSMGVDGKKMKVHDRFREVNIKLSFYELNKLQDLKKALEFKLQKISNKQKFIFEYFQTYVLTCVDNNCEQLPINFHSHMLSFISKKAFLQIPLMFRDRLKQSIAALKSQSVHKSL